MCVDGVWQRRVFGRDVDRNLTGGGGAKTPPQLTMDDETKDVLWDMLILFASCIVYGVLGMITVMGVE